MIAIIVAIAFGALMIGLARWANARFRAEERLPMQWSLPDTVNWTAPRVVALGFIPSLSIGILTLYVLGMLNFAPRPGQGWLEFPVLILLGALFLASQLLHLWLIERTLRRKGG